MLTSGHQQREKKKKKRLADPSRQNYSSILDQTNTSGSGAFESLARQSGGEASENEAAAVAKAIGLNEGFGAWKGFRKEGEDGSPLIKTVSGRSDATSEVESPSPMGPLVDDSLMEDVPEIEDLETSALSDAGQNWEEAEDEEGADSTALKEVGPVNDVTFTGSEVAEVGKSNDNKVRDGKRV